MSSNLKTVFRKKEVQAALGLLFFLFFLSVHSVSAQSTRSYSYDEIRYAIHINKDSTVDVREYQTFRFIGKYHQGWRNIPKKGIDDLRGVTVVDTMTGKSFLYSPQRLVKTDPASWGKYTTFFENGEYIIEWYYDAEDVVRTYELSYTLHGAIGFYADHDELYWNLFTDYTVPIGRVEAVVSLPQSVAMESLQVSLYVIPQPLNSQNASWSIVPTDKGPAFRFVFLNVPVGADMTIAPGWPRGIVDRSAYWQSWFLTYWGYIGAGIVALLTVIAIVLRWFLTERYHAGRGVIIPEYAPPRELPPAMADILVHEKLSPRAWSATVIDLAIRGYLKIEEKERGKMDLLLTSVLPIVAITLPLIIISFIFVPGILNGSFNWNLLFPGALIVFLVSPRMTIEILSGEKTLKDILSPKKDYILTRLDVVKSSEQSLEEYEKKFLVALFGSSPTFDTKKIQKAKGRSMNFHGKLKKLEEEILNETVRDTDAYVVGFRKWRDLRIPHIIAVALIIWAWHFTSLWTGHQLIVFLLITGYCFVTFFSFFSFNPRLNMEGQILREEWLGFKLYLETAERYRMQNLTPELFEKYLPYAIIFGVEKKWGEAFEGIGLPEPSWYGGPPMVTSTSLQSLSRDFSPAVFSSSFSSTFSLSLSVSGGGGSAGGGGGGGGGGAS